MPVTKPTLERIVAELPTLPWSDADLDELLTPGAGIITGFQEFVMKARALAGVDLTDTPLAEQVPRPPRPARMGPAR
jgi:hypothetical protein